jgi:hypothetical protein
MNISDDDRRRGAAKAHKHFTDTPKVTTTWRKALNWRRFDDRKMVVREKRNPMPVVRWA